MSIYRFRGLTFGGTDNPEITPASAVGPDFFTVFRVQPLLGRTLTPDDERPGTASILLGYQVWRDRFGSDPSIAGRDVTIDSERFTVVGVMPDKFRMPDYALAWVPLAWTDSERAVRGNHNYRVVARLKPQATIGQANSELAAMAARLEQLYPEDDKGWGATLVPLHEQFIGDVRTALLVLLGAVAFVLLIACANAWMNPSPENSSPRWSPTTATTASPRAPSATGSNPNAILPNAAGHKITGPLGGRRPHRRTRRPPEARTSIGENSPLAFPSRPLIETKSNPRHGF